jgi:hypothetical protein
MRVDDQLHALAALPLGKETQYRPDIGLDSPDSRYDRSGENKQVYFCRKSNTRSLKVRSLVTISTETCNYVRLFTNKRKECVASGPIRTYSSLQDYTPNRYVEQVADAARLTMGSGTVQHVPIS